MLVHRLRRWPNITSALGNKWCLYGILHINNMLSGLMSITTGQGRWPESVTRTGSGHHGSWSDTNSSHKLPPDRGLVRTRVWYCLPVPTGPEACTDWSWGSDRTGIDISQDQIAHSTRNDIWLSQSKTKQMDNWRSGKEVNGGLSPLIWHE